jgi:hypothetical protein
VWFAAGERFLFHSVPNKKCSKGAAWLVRRLSRDKACGLVLVMIAMLHDRARTSDGVCGGFREDGVSVSGRV